MRNELVPQDLRIAQPVFVDFIDYTDIRVCFTASCHLFDGPPWVSHGLLYYL